MTASTENPEKLELDVGMIVAEDAAPERRHTHRRPSRGLIVFTVPALVWYLLFMLGPVASMFYFSVVDWPTLIAPRLFNGLDNYRKVFGDPVFHAALHNTALQILVVIPVMIPLAFMLGYYLSTQPAGHRILRVLFFTPALISLSVQGMVFLAVLSPNGLVNGFLAEIGLGREQSAWLAGLHSALWCIIGINLWSGIGFTAVLFSARLASISPDIYEAAELDGAGHWNRMWKVSFPIARDFIGVTTMLQFVWTLFNSAGLILLLTRGGPGNSSVTLSYLVYEKAFVQSNIGYSQAVGVLLFAVGLVGMGLIRLTFRARY
jgi:multiple sugar transport system permease protein